MRTLRSEASRSVTRFGGAMLTLGATASYAILTASAGYTVCYLLAEQFTVEHPALGVVLILAGCMAALVAAVALLPALRIVASHELRHTRSYLGREQVVTRERASGLRGLLRDEHTWRTLGWTAAELLGSPVIVAIGFVPAALVYDACHTALFQLMGGTAVVYWPLFYGHPVLLQLSMLGELVVAAAWLMFCTR